MPRFKATLLLLSLATACVPASLLAQQQVAQNTYGAVPGLLNFVQGQANIDGRPIQTNTDTAGKLRQLHIGETLATATGSADILLAPGALLRVGHDSTVRMVAADANRSEVRLEQGIANVSVNVVRHDDLLLIDLQNGQTQILSRGLYTFNTADNTMRVFNGEAEVFPGTDTSSNIKPVKVKEGHELTLGGNRAKPAEFDRELADSDLLPWTGPKETQAALTTAPRHGDGGGYAYAGYYPSPYGFYGDGYGYPYYAAYDYPYWGPYGFWGYPFFGVGFGFWGGGFYRGPVMRGPVYRGGYVGGFRGGYAGHAFAAGGGFHGGAFGGFHGGGGRR